MATDRTFHLAITMAGAISAGAYTAGMMDYLLEVLDKWERLKKDDKFKAKLPKHDFFLGRNNCKSFLQNYFKFKVSELDDKDSPFYRSYPDAAKEPFLITNKNSITDQEWLPIIPDVNILLDNGADRATVINREYRKNKFPRLSDREFSARFRSMRPRILCRLNLILDTVLQGKHRAVKNVVLICGRVAGFILGKDLFLGGIKKTILEDLREWEMIRPDQADPVTSTPAQIVQCRMRRCRLAEN